MKINELLNEAYIAPQIRNILRQKGYKFLGSGVDQQAYLAPDGMILKIFGTRYQGSNEVKLSKGQKLFLIYADYCRKNENNPFLPNFTDWSTFQYKDNTYLQIKMERLFPFKGKFLEWADILDSMSIFAENSKSNDAKKKFIDKQLDYYGSTASELFSYLGEEKFNLLWNTLYDLTKVANKNGVDNLDLHPGNWMLGSDGHVVISDPFHISEI